MEFQSGITQRLEVQHQMHPEHPSQQVLWQENTSNLIKELSDKTQASQQYQKLADLQWARNQMELVLRQTTSNVNWLRQELDI
ncbi:hypothetical protein BDW62DRAFT_204044 [Aspergillus aurantiobrunneus]